MGFECKSNLLIDGITQNARFTKITSKWINKDRIRKAINCFYICKVYKIFTKLGFNLPTLVSYFSNFQNSSFGMQKPNID
jgi:hypothetical protein